MAQGVEVVESKGAVTATPHEVLVETTGKVITAKNIILAPGSVPFVPRGVQVDEKTVFTSDGALKLEFIPDVRIVLPVMMMVTMGYDIYCRYISSALINLVMY